MNAPDITPPVHRIRRIRPVTIQPAHGLLRRIAYLSAWGVGVVIVLMMIASFFVDEPLRRYMERELNAELKGYSVQLPALSFHPLGFSVTLKNLTVAQTAHPKPPLALIPMLHASVHWRALLHARPVADFLFRKPQIHIDLPQVRNEVADPVPLKDKGWQQAVETIYPLKINLLRVEDADVLYIDEDDPQRPLHFAQMNLVAENIRNVRSPERVYPSNIHVDGIIFDTGRLHLDGHANFLAEPFAAINVDIGLDKVKLDYFKPIASRANFWITGGTLSSAGHVEYGPHRQNVRLKNVTLQGLKVDYFHEDASAAQERARAAKVEQKVSEVTHETEAVARVDHFQITDGTLGYADHSGGYWLFLGNSDMRVDNLSNQRKDGPATVALKGQFMGSGETVVDARVDPAAPSSNLTVSAQIEGTDLRALNDLFRSTGNFDVAAGQFSLYSQVTIKGEDISGYIKPIFRDMKVYSRPQDKPKPLLHQVYEGLIGALKVLLENREGELGTRVDISGRVSQPETSRLEIVLGLLENAFIKAISHEFELPTHAGENTQEAPQYGAAPTP